MTSFITAPKFMMSSKNIRYCQSLSIIKMKAKFKFDVKSDYRVYQKCQKHKLDTEFQIVETKNPRLSMASVRCLEEKVEGNKQEERGKIKDGW